MGESLQIRLFGSSAVAVLKEGIHVCAQNCSATAEGAFTGEVSCDHLIDYRIEHVMIG